MKYIRTYENYRVKKNREEIIKESQKHIVNNVLKKVDVVYRQIKKNEKSPKTDYLFMNHGNDKNSQLQKSILKMNQLNAIDLQQQQQQQIETKETETKEKDDHDV